MKMKKRVAMNSEFSNFYHPEKDAVILTGFPKIVGSGGVEDLSAGKQITSVLDGLVFIRPEHLDDDGVLLSVEDN
jgi:hypothetical protein